jgi:LuxR family maltose regulon positive regulatory protein
MLLDALPPQARLILLSREDPPLPVARLRARGQLVEIRQDELRFTAEEAASFLNQVMGLSLTGGQIQTLEERTEGWIAGLQMVALALQGIAIQTEFAPGSVPSQEDREDRVGFVHAFSRSQRFILDYLVEEVLDRQPKEIRAFLIRTSILDRFNAELCEAVIGEWGVENSKTGTTLSPIFHSPISRTRNLFPSSG